MWKAGIGSVLVLASLMICYEAWRYWGELSTGGSFVIGAAAGACLTAGLFLLLWRPSHPATRYEAKLGSPSPWDRNRWRSP